MIKQADKAPKPDIVPAAGRQANATTCHQSAENAAQATLMVVEFQKQYRARPEAICPKQLNLTPPPPSNRSPH
jgi:hypothetical protein